MCHRRSVDRLKYAVVTPVRDDARNLIQLGQAMVAQTISPAAWVIVDSGSTDETMSVARGLVATAEWITLQSAPGDVTARSGASTGRAFDAGLQALGDLPDIIVKLDADVSFVDTHCAQLVEEFRRRPRLGMASGFCLEQSAGVWRTAHMTEEHLPGAMRAYRRECLLEVRRFEEPVGWDGVDELRAAVLGWETGCIHGLAYFHHRPIAARDAARHRRWEALGETSYYMRYRWSYLVLRALHHARRDPAALAMVSSFLRSAARHEPRLQDAQVVSHLRRQQRLRQLFRRAREVTGRIPVTANARAALPLTETTDLDSGSHLTEGE